MTAAAPTSLPEIADRAAPFGLAPLGAFEPGAGDDAPTGARALVLIGLRDPQAWTACAESPEARDGAPDPLDRWSLRVGTALAADLGGEALFPFGGPPYRPFLRWAQRTGRAWGSPIGMFVHAERGLWMSVRCAVATPYPVATPPDAEIPCSSCAEKPCAGACPVDAFASGSYDVAACTAHLRAPEGRDCLQGGCLARRACPVGTTFRPIPDQAAFHMAAFLNARDEEAA